MELTVLRHPRVSAQGLCYGRCDVALAEGHAAQTAALVKTLPAPRVLVTSPAERCRVVADALARRHGVDPRIEPALQELNFGDWEGVPWDQIDRRDSDHWAEDPVTRAPPRGESFQQLSTRVLACVAALDGHATLVTHAGPIRALRMAAEGLSFEAAFAAPVPYTTPIHLRLDATALGV